MRRDLEEAGVRRQLKRRVMVLVEQPLSPAAIRRVDGVAPAQHSSSKAL